MITRRKQQRWFGGLAVVATMIAAGACGRDLVIAGGSDSDAGPLGEGGAVDAPIVSADGATDALDATVAEGSADAQPIKRIVFVTATKVTGAMELSLSRGIDGGNALCKFEAQAAGREAGVIAWLSLPMNPVIKRLRDDGAQWTLPRGEVVFPSHAYIAEGGAPLVPIVQTADGGTIPAGTASRGVFTGTGTGGNYVFDYCTGWTVADPSTALGGDFGAIQTWSFGAQPIPCDEQHHLICFEN